VRPGLYITGDITETTIARDNQVDIIVVGVLQDPFCGNPLFDLEISAFTAGNVRDFTSRINQLNA
jgi:hypothetical protein